MATLFLLVIYAAFISLGLPDSLLGASWPIIRLEFGMALDSAGIITMIISGSTIVSSLFCEKLIRRFGTGLVTAVSVFLTAVSLLGISFSHSFVWMILLAVPLGLGAGAVDAGLNNYVALHYKAYHMSWLHCFWGVGAFCGPLIIAGYLQKDNWRGGYFTISLIQLAVCALLFLSLPLWKKANGATPPAAQNQPEREPQAPPAANVFKVPGVLFVLFTFSLYCAIEYTIGLWGSSYLVEARGFAAPSAARAVALYYGGITIGRFLNGFLTIKFTSKQLIRTGIVVIVAGALLLALPLSSYFSMGALLLMGLGCAPVFPSLIHETPYNFGAQNSQKIMGLQMAFAYCGSTFIPPVIGLVANNINVALIPYFPLLFSLCILFFTEALNRATRRGAGKTTTP